VDAGCQQAELNASPAPSTPSKHDRNALAQSFQTIVRAAQSLYTHTHTKEIELRPCTLPPYVNFTKEIGFIVDADKMSQLCSRTGSSTPCASLQFQLLCILNGYGIQSLQRPLFNDEHVKSVESSTLSFKSA
jgi:hypothetical protein